MRVGIMQPYLFPYLGYFQLIAATDLFVLYDDVAFSKGGWINRNRLLDPRAGQPFLFTVPVRNAGPGRRIDELEIGGPVRWREKLLRRIRDSYRKALRFNEVWPVVEHSLNNPEPQLSRFLRTSLVNVCEFLNIPTRMACASSGLNNRHLRGIDRVIDSALFLEAKEYVNAEGGRALYPEESFREHGIQLRFLRHLESPYPQVHGGNFVPRLSIIDALMNVPADGLPALLAAREIE